jgi:N6-L-threonylcarbamoyladenine synthase
LSNIAANQKIHLEYGGVVPELASRAHQQNIIPVVHQALNQANIQQNEICAIGFTRDLVFWVTSCGNLLC